LTERQTGDRQGKKRDDLGSWRMRAFGELIANVAKTVDQFMTDNISPGSRTRLPR